MNVFLHLTLIGCTCALGTVSAENLTICEIDNVTYNIGESVPNNDTCKSCICAPEELDQQRCDEILCDEPKCGPCGLKYYLDECCPGCTPECVINNVTYCEGARTDHNQCEVCVCIPDVPGQQACLLLQLGCPSIGCPPGTKPEGERTPGEVIIYSNISCVPDGCEVNGTLYALGAAVPPIDDCALSCFCHRTGEVVCARPPCNANPDCGGFDYAIGGCCPLCPTCAVVGPGYKPGDKLPIPGRDPCSFDCFCDYWGRTDCRRRITVCPVIECPLGTMKMEESIPGECCNNVTCVPITGCEVNGTKYAPGASVPSDDPCRLACFCDGSTGEAVCAIVDCFLFECPDGQRLKYLPGQCCPICVTDYTNCSFQFCKKRNALCTKTDAIGDCTNKATSCMAAYYSKNERPPPAECSRRNKCAGITGERLDKCIRKWGKCVKDAFKDQYGKTRGKLRKKRFFQTLEYPCGG